MLATIFDFHEYKKLFAPIRSFGIVQPLIVFQLIFDDSAVNRYSVFYTKKMKDGRIAYKVLKVDIAPQSPAEIMNVTFIPEKFPAVIGEAGPRADPECKVRVVGYLTPNEAGSRETRERLNENSE